jgi:hypothetical protein
MDTKLNAFAECFVELVEVILVLRNLAEEVKRLSDEVLADDLEDLVLLQGFSRDVERKILRVDNTLDKVEVFGNEIFAVIHDEDTADVKFNVVAFLLRLEEVEGSALGDEDYGLKFELTLNREVLDCKVILPVVGKTLVESAVPLSSDIRGIASPNRLCLVELLVRNFFFLGLFLLFSVIIDFLDLSLFFGLFLFFILNFLKNMPVQCRIILKE